MIAEYISYRCKPVEWETMRLVLGLGVPIGLHALSMTEDACMETYDSLCAQGFLIPGGDQVVVDRLFAFLLTQASQSAVALVAQCEGRRLVLHHTAKLELLSEWTDSLCVLTPLPTLASAREPLFAAFHHLSVPADLSLQTPELVVRAMSAMTREEARSALDKLYNDCFSLTLNQTEA